MKALFFDIDGTLVSTVKHRIPQSAIDAILEAQSAGNKIFISTGRTVLQFPYLEDIPFDGYITENGAFVCTGGIVNAKGLGPSIGSAETIFSRAFPQQLADSIADYSEGPDRFPVLFMSEKMVTMNYIDENVIEFNKLVDIDATRLTVMPARERVKFPVHQFCAFVGPEREAVLKKGLLKDCDTSRWNRFFMDVNLSGVSKSFGMDRILEHFGIDRSDSIAFGDGGNDIPILRHAALGVAMGNASDSVKSAAGYVTDDVDSDGLRNALRKFVL